jgi:hypothetical protein
MATYRESEVPAQPHPGCSTHGEAHGQEAGRQSQRPPRPRACHPRPSLGEDATGAGGLAAEELPDAEPPGNAVATPRQIGQRSGIMAVDGLGWDITGRAPGFHLCGRDQERDAGMRVVEVPGIKSERESLRQDMGQRFSNLHSC